MKIVGKLTKGLGSVMISGVFAVLAGVFAGLGMRKAWNNEATEEETETTEETEETEEV